LRLDNVPCKQVDERRSGAETLVRFRVLSSMKPKKPFQSFGHTVSKLLFGYKNAQSELKREAKTSSEDASQHPAVVRFAQ